MDIAEKIKILEESKSLLDKVTKELKKRAYRKAETEREGYHLQSNYSRMELKDGVYRSSLSKIMEVY